MLDKSLITKEFEGCTSMQDIEKLYDKYLGKTGLVSSEFKNLASLSIEEKKEKGAFLSDLKTFVENQYQSKLKIFKKESIDKMLSEDIIDVSIPGVSIDNGYYTLLSRTRREMEEIFKGMGFVVEYGNDVVTKNENFYTLNIPSTHPATEMHDTFYLEQKDVDGDNLIFRTQTSAMQNILMKKYGTPLKVVVPGKVYRYENTDASHDTVFWQLEGIVIDEGISISNFKNLMRHFLSTLLGKEIKMRMRPGYFPFVEPGFEIDASCPMCDGAGCSFCKQTGWSEILGAGMIHPYVLQEGGVDRSKYNGFAFGIGVNRLVAVKYAIKDIRLFTNMDMRFIESF